MPNCRTKNEVMSERGLLITLITSSPTIEARTTSTENLPLLDMNSTEERIQRAESLLQEIQSISEDIQSDASQLKSCSDRAIDEEQSDDVDNEEKSLLDGSQSEMTETVNVENKVQKIEPNESNDPSPDIEKRKHDLKNKIKVAKEKIEEAEKLMEEMESKGETNESTRMATVKKEVVSQKKKIEEFEEELSKNETKETQGSSAGWKIAAVAGGVVGAVGLVVATPLIVGAAGFTAGGIAAGSMAAQMMSAAAIANGGGVAAGSAVAILQSVGAAGLGAGGMAAVGTAGAAVGSAVAAGATKFANLFRKRKE